MNGWLSTVGIYREGSFLGAISGPCYRVPGMREARLDSSPRARYLRVSPFGSASEATPLHMNWTLTVSREFSFSEYNSFVLDAMRTDDGETTIDGGLATYVRGTATDGEPQTFGACVLFPDGIRRRLRGMTPKRHEILVQSRRVIVEETEWAVCRVEAETVAESEVTLPHAPVAAHEATLAGTFTGGVEALMDTFSAQLIFAREIQPCQFSSAGIASRLSIASGWEALGRTSQQLVGDLSYILGTPVAAKMTLAIARGSNSLEIHVPSARAIVTSQPIVQGGQVDNEINWQAQEQGHKLFVTTEVKPL